MSERRKRHHYGAELRQGEAEKAERLVREELARQGWDDEELECRAKTDRQKARLALRLRRGDDDDRGVDRATAADGEREHAEEWATIFR